MILNVSVEDVPSISKALNGLDSAFFNAIVPTIQGALFTLKKAMVEESFVDSIKSYDFDHSDYLYSEQYILEEAAVNYSLGHLTNALNDVY